MSGRKTRGKARVRELRIIREECKREKYGEEKELQREVEEIEESWS
jgi:hypothetical protein